MSDVTKYINFEVKTINRQDIQNAPYNPRVIGDEERKRLRKNIKERGLMETLVWNKQTGNLVSGNQRLGILDGLEKRKDYDLVVAVVDMDEKTEKEQNIAFNSTNLQGQFDIPKVQELFPDIDPNEAGITQEEIEQLNLGIHLSEKMENAEEDIDDQVQEFDRIRKEKQEERKKQDPETTNKDRENVNKRNQQAKENENQSHHIDYVVLSFSSAEAKENFCQKWGFDHLSQYIKGEKLDEVINDTQNG